MATVPRVAVDEGGAASRVAGARLWQGALAAALLVCAVYVALPPEQVTLRNIAYALVELGAVCAVLAGVRLHHPSVPLAWLLIAAGLSAYLIGDVLWTAYEIADRDPFPSPADVFYLAGYPLIGAALVVATLRRAHRGVEASAVIDAALLTVVATLVVWVYVARPALDDATLSSLEKAVTVAYPLGDLILLAVAARFVMGTRWNVTSLRLLVLGLGLTLLGDLLYALDLVGHLSAHLQLADALLLLGVVLMGLAALHPSMTALTEKAPPRQSEAEFVRLDDLAAEAVESARPAAEAKNLELRLTIANDLPALSADATRLTQMPDRQVDRRGARRHDLGREHARRRNHVYGGAAGRAVGAIRRTTSEGGRR